MSNTLDLRFFTPFERISSHFLEKLEESLEIIHIPKGALLFKRSKILDEDYFLIDGTVNLIDREFRVEMVEK